MTERSPEPPADPGPRPGGIAETALYVADLEVAERFYRDLLGARLLVADDRLRALAIAPGAVLLLFRTGGSLSPIHSEGGMIPSHDGRGILHVAFRIAPGDLDAWEGRLGEQGIEVESRVRWERGGTSLYFRDPDGHSVELATPGVWDND